MDVLNDIDMKYRANKRREAERSERNKRAIKIFVSVLLVVFGMVLQIAIDKILNYNTLAGDIRKCSGCHVAPEFVYWENNKK